MAARGPGGAGSNGPGGPGGPPPPPYVQHGFYDRGGPNWGDPNNTPHGFSAPNHGPPPPGGWNPRWEGPPRDIGLAQADFEPFAYNGYNAIPVFNPIFGGWGFWFFGIWIPLY